MSSEELSISLKSRSPVLKFNMSVAGIANVRVILPTEFVLSSPPREPPAGVHCALISTLSKKA